MIYMGNNCDISDGLHIQILGGKNTLIFS